MDPHGAKYVQKLQGLVLPLAIFVKYPLKGVLENLMTDKSICAPTTVYCQCGAVNKA
jgi:hypothetical protein